MTLLSFFAVILVAFTEEPAGQGDGLILGYPLVNLSFP